MLEQSELKDLPALHTIVAFWEKYDEVQVNPKVLEKLSNPEHIRRMFCDIRKKAREGLDDPRLKESPQARNRRLRAQKNYTMLLSNKKLEDSMQQKEEPIDA